MLPLSRATAAGLVEAAAGLEIRRLLTVAAGLGGPIRVCRATTSSLVGRRRAVEIRVQRAPACAHAAGERAVDAASGDGDRVLAGVARVGDGRPTAVWQTCCGSLPSPQLTVHCFTSIPLSQRWSVYWPPPSAADSPQNEGRAWGLFWMLV